MKTFIMNLNCIYFLVIIYFFTFVSCSSRNAIGVGYVNQKKTKIYEKNSLKSDVLENISKSELYDILAINLPDKDSQIKLLWQKVLYKDKIGYLSQEEEIVSKNVSSFFVPTNKKYGLVTATSLMLRDAPGLEGKVIGKLKTKEIIEILLETKNSVKIDRLDGTWAKVRTASGSTGFVFTAYVMRDESQENLAKTENIELYQTGWAILKSNPQKVFSLKNGAILPNKPDDEFPKKGDIVYFNSKLVSKDGKVYFNLVGKEEPPCFDDGQCYKQSRIFYEGYVHSENLKTYPTHALLYFDNFKRELKEKGNPSKGLIEEIDRRLYDNADLETLTFFERKFGNKIIYDVTVDNKPTYIPKNRNERKWLANLLIIKNENNYSTLIYGGEGMITFSDLNNDGIDEVLVKEEQSRLGTISQALYTFVANEFKLLTSYNGEEGKCGSISFDENSILLSDSGCTPEEKEEYGSFKYKLKKGNLVSTK